MVGTICKCSSESRLFLWKCAKCS